jgi:hypothetical protein
VADDIVTFLRDDEQNNPTPMQALLSGYAADEIERLRRLGDTLAYHVRADEAKEMYSAVHAWEEARRG